MIFEYVGEVKMKGSIDEKLRVEREMGIRVERGRVKVSRAVEKMKREENEWEREGILTRQIVIKKRIYLVEERRRVGEKSEWRYGMWRERRGKDSGEWKIEWREE
ncbi:hypothetical protein DFJ73DRAFT_763448 [Zopfochytrium polystomum]|nr:hypothetical protein DFJ73DRAFT_763448 [Zopfochytrium polystomum]